MFYYNKLQAVKDEERASYWVAPDFHKDFRKLVKQHKAAGLSGYHIEWAVNRLRNERGAKAAGFIQY